MHCLQKCNYDPPLTSSRIYCFSSFHASILRNLSLLTAPASEPATPAAPSSSSSSSTSSSASSSSPPRPPRPPPPPPRPPQPPPCPSPARPAAGRRRTGTPCTSRCRTPRCTRSKPWEEKKVLFCQWEIHFRLELFLSLILIVNAEEVIDNPFLG